MMKTDEFPISFGSQCVTDELTTIGATWRVNHKRQRRFVDGEWLLQYEIVYHGEVTYFNTMMEIVTFINEERP